MISINGIEIKPTIFPDKTSQVWKLPEDLLDQLHKDYIITVKWDFENEVEFLWLAQLKTLLDQYSPIIHLDMPYMPYGRQDKIVRNDKTFALTTFATLLNALSFAEVRVLDVHNNPRAHAINNLQDLSPSRHIEFAYEETKSNLLLFPDAGASTRYQNYRIGPYVTAEKIRDQASGKITEFSLDGSVRDKTVLVVDDICDGGATFVLAAKHLKKFGAKEISLFTTHGLYTQGINRLRDSGIKRFFTYKGELVPTSHGCWDYKCQVR